MKERRRKEGGRGKAKQASVAAWQLKRHPPLFLLWWHYARGEREILKEKRSDIESSDLPMMPMMIFSERKALNGERGRGNTYACNIIQMRRGEETPIDSDLIPGEGDLEGGSLYCGEEIPGGRSLEAEGWGEGRGEKVCGQKEADRRMMVTFSRGWQWGSGVEDSGSKAWRGNGMSGRGSL